MIHRSPVDLVSFFELSLNREIPAFERGVSHLQHLNLGAGYKEIKGTKSLGLPEWDAETMPIPAEDNSIGVIWALGFFDHIRNVIPLLAECQRVLAPGGTINIWVAYYDSILANQDLDHKSKYNEETWDATFNNKYWKVGQVDWKFRIGLNMIMGLKQRNLSLLTQLIRTE